MIEKLDVIKHTDNLYDRNGFITNVACGGVIINKVNELIDVVNKQQIQLNNHECRLLDLQNRVTALDDPSYHEDEDSDWYDDPKYREQSADPYAEQRKWLGKLCKFWDGDERISHLCWGILYTITPTSPVPYCCSLGDGITSDYEHCEPVLPTDSIIYKGGDNE